MSVVDEGGEQRMNIGGRPRANVIKLFTVVNNIIS
jgi:hypothetical protein